MGATRHESAACNARYDPYRTHYDPTPPPQPNAWQIVWAQAMAAAQARGRG